MLTVRAGAYPHLDAGMMADVPVGTEVHRTRAPDPFGLYGRLTGRSRDAAVAARTGHVGQSERRCGARLAVGPRQRVRPRRARRVGAVRARRRRFHLHRRRPFDAVVTTGPPHSAHLVGLALQPRRRCRGSPTSATRGRRSTTPARSAGQPRPSASTTRARAPRPARVPTRRDRLGADAQRPPRARARSARRASSATASTRPTFPTRRRLSVRTASRSPTSARSTTCPTDAARRRSAAEAARGEDVLLRFVGSVPEGIRGGRRARAASRTSSPSSRPCRTPRPSDVMRRAALLLLDGRAVELRRGRRAGQDVRVPRLGPPRPRHRTT